MSLSSRPDSSAGLPIVMPKYPVSGATINFFSNNLSKYKYELLKALLIDNEKTLSRTQFSSTEQWEAIIVDPSTKEPTKYYFYLSHCIERRGENNYEILGENERIPDNLEINLMSNVATATRVLGRISIDKPTNTIDIQSCNYLAIKASPITPAHLPNELERSALFSFAVATVLQAQPGIYFEAKALQKIALSEDIILYFTLTQSVLCYTTNGLPYDNKKPNLKYRIAVLANELVVSDGAQFERGYDSFLQLVPLQDKSLQVQAEAKRIRICSIKNSETIEGFKAEHELSVVSLKKDSICAQVNDAWFLVRSQIAGRDVRSVLDDAIKITDSDSDIDVIVKLDEILLCAEKIALFVKRCIERKIVEVNLDLNNLLQLETNEVISKTNPKPRESDEGVARTNTIILGRLYKTLFGFDMDKKNALNSLHPIYQTQITILINSLLNETDNNNVNVESAVDIIRKIRFLLKSSTEDAYHHPILNGTFEAANEVFWKQQEERNALFLSGDVEDKIKEFNKCVTRSLSGIGSEYLEVNLVGILFLNNRYHCEVNNAQFLLQLYHAIFSFAENLHSIKSGLLEFIPAADKVFSQPKLIGSRDQIQHLVSSLSLLVDDLLLNLLSISEDDRQKMELLLANQQLGVSDNKIIGLIQFYIKLFVNDDINVLIGPMQTILSLLQDVACVGDEYKKLDKSETQDADYKIVENFYALLMVLKNIAENILLHKDEIAKQIDVFNKFIVEEVTKNETVLMSEFINAAEIMSLRGVTKKSLMIPALNSIFDNFLKNYSWCKAALESLASHRTLFNDVMHLLVANDTRSSLQIRLDRCEDILTSMIARYQAVTFDLNDMVKLSNETVPSEWFQQMLDTLLHDIDALKLALDKVVTIDPTQMKQEEDKLIALLLHSSTDFITSGKYYIIKDKSRANTQPFVAVMLTHSILCKVIDQLRHDMVIGKSLNVNSMCTMFDALNDYSSLVNAFSIVGELYLNSNGVVTYRSSRYTAMHLASQIDPTNLSSLQNRFLNYLLSHESVSEDPFYPQGLQARTIKFSNVDVKVFFNLAWGLQWRLHTREHYSPHCYEVLGDFVGSGAFVMAAYRSKGLLDPQADGSLRFGQSTRIIKYIAMTDASAPKRKEMLERQYKLSLLIPYLDEKPLVYMKHQCVMIEKWLDDELLSNILKRQQSGLEFDTYQWLTMARGILLNASMFRDLSIIHNDLKPDNVVCGVRRARAFDLGLSIESHSVSLKNSGTPVYMAPEKFNKGGKITPSIDDFAIGLILKKLLQAFPIQQTIANDVYDYLSFAIESYMTKIDERNLEEADKVEQAVNAVVASNPLFNKGNNKNIPAQFQSFFRQYRQVSMASAEEFKISFINEILVIGENFFTRAYASIFQKVRLSVIGSGRNSVESIIAELAGAKAYTHRQYHSYFDNLIRHISTDANQLKKERLQEIVTPIQKMFRTSSMVAISASALSNAAAECKATHFASPLNLTTNEHQLLLTILNGLTEANLAILSHTEGLDGSHVARRMTSLEAMKQLDDLLFSMRLRKIDPTNTLLVEEVKTAHDIAASIANEFSNHRMMKIGHLPLVFFDRKYKDSFFSCIRKLKQLNNKPEVIAEVIETLDIEFLRTQVFISIDEVMVCLERVLDCFLKQRDELHKLATTLRDEGKQAKQALSLQLDALIRRSIHAINRSIDEKAFFSIDSLVQLNHKVEKDMVKIKAERARIMLTMTTSNPAGSPVLVSRCSETLHSPRKETPVESPHTSLVLGGS